MNIELKEMQIILFKCTEDTFGMPNPYVPDGTIMISVQDGVANVVKWVEPTPPDDPMPTWRVSTNSESLKKEALELVKEHYPEIDLFDRCLHFLCPNSLAGRAVFEGNN